MKFSYWQMDMDMAIDIISDVQYNNKVYLTDSEQFSDPYSGTDQGSKCWELTYTNSTLTALLEYIVSLSTFLCSVIT